MNLYESGEYRASKQWPYAVSAGCVVYRGSGQSLEVLLLPRDASKNKWGRSGGQAVSYHLPKGHVHIDETLTQAALRETAEEAGVEARVITYLGTRQDIFRHPNTAIDTDKLVHYFAAEWVGELPVKDDEHDGVIWVEPEEAMKLLGKPNPKGEDVLITRLLEALQVMRV